MFKTENNFISFLFATGKKEYVFRGCTSFEDGNVNKVRDNCADLDLEHNMGGDSVSTKNYNIPYVCHYKAQLVYFKTTAKFKNKSYPRNQVTSLTNGSTATFMAKNQGKKL